MAKSKTKNSEHPLIDGIPFVIDKSVEELTDETVSLIATALITADPSLLSTEASQSIWGATSKIESLRGSE